MSVLRECVEIRKVNTRIKNMRILKFVLIYTAVCMALFIMSLVSAIVKNVNLEKI